MDDIDKKVDLQTHTKVVKISILCNVQLTTTTTATIIIIIIMIIIIAHPILFQLQNCSFFLWLYL